VALVQVNGASALARVEWPTLNGSDLRSNFFPEKYMELAVGQTRLVAKEAVVKTLAIPAMWTGVFKIPRD